MELAFQDYTIWRSTRVTLAEVFDKKIWHHEDFDLLIAPEGEERNKSYIQIVRFTGDVEGNTENIFGFLEEKKFKIPKDEKLLLLVLLEKGLKLKYFELSQKLKESNVPYGQIFILGTRKHNMTNIFFCFQIYPEVKTLGELDPSSLRN
jgi:predicted AlkP superfamily pyrophosphatase or phosphodiesterase